MTSRTKPKKRGPVWTWRMTEDAFTYRVERRGTFINFTIDGWERGMTSKQLQHAARAAVRALNAAEKKRTK